MKLCRANIVCDLQISSRSSCLQRYGFPSRYPNDRAHSIGFQSNHRTDEYAHPLAFLKRVLTAIREPGVVPKDFVLGIKLNAADYVDKSAAASSATTDADHVLDHFKQVVTWGLVDFIEVSGGDYEHPGVYNTRNPLFILHSTSKPLQIS